MIPSMPIFIFAHTLPGDAGAIDGFLQPVLGFEFLLATLAVGILSAQIGGRGLWSVPLAYMGMMTVGAVAGLPGPDLGYHNQVMGASILLSGSAIIALQLLVSGQKRDEPTTSNAEWGLLLFVGLLGLLHGYAHGSAVPADQDLAFFSAFAIGVLSSTIGLHVIGALIGYIAVRASRARLIVSGCGALLVVISLFFIFSSSVST